jgi:hypothetical protein
VLGPASNQILRISETGAQQAATAKRP